MTHICPREPTRWERICDRLDRRPPRGGLVVGTRHPEGPMKPEDVPDGVVEAMRQASLAWDEDGAVTYWRHTVTAAWPEIERQMLDGKALIAAKDLAELLDYVVGKNAIRVVEEPTLDRAFTALKEALARGEQP